jgi:hypothetical protein
MPTESYSHFPHLAKLFVCDATHKVYDGGMTHQKTDQQLIQELGGPTKVARLLGFDKHGPQRVQNWLLRGIPAHMKLRRPDLFLSQDAIKHEVGEATNMFIHTHMD